MKNADTYIYKEYAKFFGKKTKVIFSNSSSAVRKSYWKENQFNELVTGSEDAIWALSAKKKGYIISYYKNVHLPVLEEQVLFLT